MSVSVVMGDEVNQQPYSPSRGLATEQPYQKHEMRLQLSARTKIASGLLTGPTSKGKDSLWFGYTQQSYWQLFNGDISRPFRTTDHEPGSSTSTDGRPAAAGLALALLGHWHRAPVERSEQSAVAQLEPLVSDDRRRAWATAGSCI